MRSYCKETAEHVLHYQILKVIYIYISTYNNSLRVRNAVISIKAVSVYLLFKKNSFFFPLLADGVRSAESYTYGYAESYGARQRPVSLASILAVSFDIWNLGQENACFLQTYILKQLLLKKLLLPTIVQIYTFLV